MSRPRVKIISNESGDWEILQCDEFEASGHRLSRYDYKDLLEYLGYDVDIEEISDEEMEEISQLKREYISENKSERIKSQVATKVMTLSGENLLIYLGSKNRLSKHLAPIIQSYVDKGCNGYLEPFVGGANMIDKIQCDNKIGSDVDRYVIATLQGLQNGLEPPREVSKELYDDIKNNKDNYSDFLVGYIGYELSFGAKWFGGYVKRDDKKFRGDIYSYKSCMKQAPLLKDITFKCCSFEEYKDIEGYVIYCDPPYAGTTPYKQPEFPYEKFYDWCRKIGEKNIVLISEYSMPDDFECIWQKEMMCTLDSNRKENDKKNIRVEKLFTYKN